MNLGSCQNYSDGCNDHTITNGVDTQTTKNQCIWAGTPKCLDTATGSTDTQLTDLDAQNKAASVKALATDFRLKTFSSCGDMETTLKNFIKDYYDAHPYNGGYYRGGAIPLMVKDAVGKDATPSAISSSSVG